LYQREGTSVFAGFAPLLAQWPVFSVLYLLFRSPTVAGGPNRLLTRALFGVPLGDHWLSGAGVLSAAGAVFLGTLAVLALICWLSARVARRMTAVAPAPGLLIKVLPYLTVVIAAFAPLAAAVYLVVSTGWSVAERWLFVSSRGGRQIGGAPRRGGHTLRERADRP
jgi:YidC/Oxa1 family membrane protein insertase